MMNYKLISCRIIIFLILLQPVVLYSQKYISTGEEPNRRTGNRLISVKSANGEQLYRPDRIFPDLKIVADGIMNEPEWENAPVISPFINKTGIVEKTSVRVLYDRSNIYLFWQVEQPDGITANMKNNDELIVSDDYVQVDLKPWLPDDIIHGRDYSYSIAINPAGIIWDSYFDPYLGGFYFSSWNSSSVVKTITHQDRWEVEMIIPFSGLDIYSDPGWKWNLEFHHASNKGNHTEVTSCNVGITVQQDTLVRQPGLVSYYWPRSEFMQEIKPDLSKQEEKRAEISHLRSLPKINGKEDSNLWVGTKKILINHTDKMGEQLFTDLAGATIGISGNHICFKLEADGTGIRKGAGSEARLGAGMAAQMAGVNGVYVDQTLFLDECFWIIIQPRAKHEDNVHQDYYLLVLNNLGQIKGTHYDKFGEPFRDWEPLVEVDIYNTKSGWGAELILDLRSLDISVDFSDEWGLNIFRNRLLDKNNYVLQAWKYTANDFFNPLKFGTLNGLFIDNISVFESFLKRKIKEIQSFLSSFTDEYKDEISKLRKELSSIKIQTQNQMRAAKQKLEKIDNDLGILMASTHYNSVPHPAITDKYPLMDITFIGSKGWAVGALGTVLITENFGKDWHRINIDTDADLYRVRFINENEGWIAGGRIRMADTNESMRHDKRGGYGYIFHTTDGGKTWKCQFGEKGRHLFALHFVDENTGYAAGERGFLLKTTDGGKHWKTLSTSGTLNWLYGMTFTDHNNGFAVGLNETVIRTHDGGESWTAVKAVADKRFYGFSPIYRDISINGNTGCIVGQNGTLLISSDGGESWEPSATLYTKEIRELMDLRYVRFTTPLRGYAVGELGNKIMTTEDGGRNWTFRDTYSSEWLRTLWADTLGNVIIAGEGEKILSSENEGLTWKVMNGKDTKVDIMTMMAHGDDAPINFNSFFAHYSINEGKKIVDIGVMSDTHSSEYEETYNLEHDRNIWMTGVGTTTNFCQFETGNNGANYYHFNQRLWEGEENVVRRMVAAIRAYKPDIIITHEGVFGDYDKPGHKVSGRAGLVAFETAGGDTDHWPELTRMGLKPWQPKKLYNLEGQSYPWTIDLSWIGDQPLKGTNLTCKEYGNYVIKNFQSQGIYYHRPNAKLCLVKTLVPVPEEEDSIFDGIEAGQVSVK